MESKKISICITYYNQENFVRDSLESVFAINFPCDYEILIGDDGSTDNTVNIVREYQKKYPNKIKLFVMDRNEKFKSINRASTNRLNLAQNVTGQYILFLDGDDFYCDKNFVKEALKVLEKDKSLIACAFNFRYLYENGKESVFCQNMPYGCIDAKNYISKLFYTHSGAIVFRNILNLERMKFLKNINIFDDNAITIYFLKFGSLFFINKTVYVYRQLCNSLWNTLSILEQNILNAFDYKYLCDLAPEFEKYIRARQCLSINYVYKNRKNIENFLKEKLKKYLLQAKENNNIFMFNILNWRNASFITKISTSIIYYKKYGFLFLKISFKQLAYRFKRKLLLGFRKN